MLTNTAESSRVPMRICFIALILSFVSYSHAAVQESKLALGNGFLSYISNQQELAAQHPSITRAIVVVHGSECNAETYFNTISRLVALEGQSEHTLIIAPHFKTPTKGGAPLEGEYVWGDEGWLRGDAPLNGVGPSSFEMMDALMKTVADAETFPNMKGMVLTGHSAGGQFTQKYALANQVENEVKNVRLRYIVLNPGSYVYLNQDRPDPNSSSGFSIPASSSCIYNDYKYGLDHLNAYLSRVAKQVLIEQYLNRDVTYLLGSADTNTDPTEVDEDCPAVLQGRFRYERGLNFKSYLDHEFTGHRHHLVTVPNVGHSEYGMYLSPEGHASLFPH